MAIQEKSIGHVNTGIGGLKGWLTHGCCVSIRKKKKVEVMGEKSDKSLQHDILLCPALPAISKRRTTIMSPRILANWSDERLSGDHLYHFKSHLIPR